MIIQNSNNINQVKSIIWILLLISSVLQFIIEFSIINFIANFICIFSTSVCLRYCFKTYVIYKYPLSTLMIFGFCLYHFILPPFITATELKPLTVNLVMPIVTLIHSSIFLYFLIISHIVYRRSKLANVISIRIARLYERVKVFEQLDVSTIYTIGFIGILAKIYALSFNNYQQTSNDAIVKLMEGISSFAFVPFLILTPKIFKIKNQNRISINKLFFVFYTLFIFALGFAINSRTFLFKGFISIFFIFFFLFIFGTYKKKISPKNVLLAIFLISFSNVFISGIAISLVNIRDIRGDISTIDLVYKSIDAVLNSQKSGFTPTVLIDKLSWDERYIDNPLFSRLCNLKYVDNIVTYSTKVNDSQVKNINDVEISKIFSILPNPILNSLDIQVNKKVATSGSMGDFIYESFSQDEYSIGSFRTGNLIGSLIISFKYYYPIVLIVISFFTFIIIDPLVKKIIINTTSGKKIIDINFSAIAFINIFFFCFYFTSAALGVESIAGLFSYITRGWIQEIVIYFLLFSIAKFLTRIFKFS